MESLLRVKDFTSIELKAKELHAELTQEIAHSNKSPQEVDKAVIVKVIALINFMIGEDYIGVTRFNEITEFLRPPCLLPH